MAYKAPPRRVSYVVPFPTGPPPPRLRLPSDGQSRHPSRNGDARPLVIRDGSPPIGQPVNEEDDGHPRHCLGVNALALDTTTVLAGPSSAADGSSSDGKRKRTPEGILYTGGRDGLIASWELGLSTRRRKRRYGVYGSERENRGRPGPLSRSDDDDISDEEEEWDQDEEEAEEAMGLLADVDGRPDPVRRRSSDQEGIPFEEQWEVAGPSSVRLLPIS